MNMTAPFICPECKTDFPTYQARFFHRRREHRVKPSNPGQYKYKKHSGAFECDQPKCGASYKRPQDLGRHKWFAHGIRGVSATALAKIKTKSNPGRTTNDAQPTAPTYTQEDLQYEGFTAFTAGEVYERLKQRAEAADVPYASFAGRVVEFIRATTHGQKLGNTHRVPILPGKASS
jgi:hypothetical protein